jgi:Spy/CpxP family protein refolding chaperone
MAMDKMDKMADCPMMTAEMRGPGAALDARTALHLSPGQVTQLETIKGKLDQHHKAAMDSMQALHRQINTLAAAPQVDEQAVRAAFDQMGQLHGAMGYEMFRAQREAATVLTPQQIDALAAVGQAKMNTGAMKGMGGMCG